MGDGKLSYYEDKTDRTPKAVIPLKDAQVEEQVDGKSQLIKLQLKHGSIRSLLLKIEQPNFRNKFLKCLQENLRAEEIPKDIFFEDLDQ